MGLAIGRPALLGIKFMVVLSRYLSRYGKTFDRYSCISDLQIHMPPRVFCWRHSSWRHKQLTELMSKMKIHSVMHRCLVVYHLLSYLYRCLAERLSHMYIYVERAVLSF